MLNPLNGKTFLKKEKINLNLLTKFPLKNQQFQGLPGWISGNITIILWLSIMASPRLLFSLTKFSVSMENTK